MKVAILGGGVAGMSCAHELCERGFEVSVFEAKPMPGGKARSLHVIEDDPTHQAVGLETVDVRTDVQRPFLPGEHGFRFFPGFYRHVVDTMARIPYGNGWVSGNLVDTTEVHVARFDREPLLLPCRFPRTPGDLRTTVKLVIDWLGGQAEVNPDETAYFGEKIWQIITSCEERRLAEYEKIDWWTFIGAGDRSAAYQKYFGNAITRSLVAAKAQRANAKTIGDIFVQILFDVLNPTTSTADRLLNGPTNDVWIDPWLRYLRSRGVNYHLDSRVTGLGFDGQRITGAQVVREGRQEDVEADLFVLAMPVERVVPLITPALARADRQLSRLSELATYVEWMNGIQFYLRRDVPIAHGHAVFMDSPWALTSVSQAQFWKDVDVSRFGDGDVRGILSVDISDWDVAGLNGKEADQCTREEVAAETWAQMKRSLNVGGRTLLRDEDVDYWFLDPAIFDADPTRPGHEVNLEPLLVNYVDTWRLRPEAVSSIPNLFMASDYVRTHTDLATMEAANEAARHAVNGILARAGSSATPCRIWKLHEPEVFAPWRAYDRARFSRHEPWDSHVADLADAVRQVMARPADAVAGMTAPTSTRPRIRFVQD